MKVEVPYLVFEVNGKEYMIDAHFSRKLERIERVSTLIRPIDRTLSKTAEAPLPILLQKNEIEGFLKNLFVEVYERSGEKLNKRLAHMRKWNILRLIGIPTGFSRHVEKDEQLAKENREAMLSLAILRKILGVKTPTELDKIKIVPKEYLYYRIELKNREIFNEKGEKDGIYTQLLEIDGGFRHALLSMI
ncbi:hypothetical protein VFC49_05720 [Thermococcus sp. SY098]|uniref:hypothetical protein n=1 Tax=Thermococcus sp. SY098 TaxID=3111325 RepID=UPI002D78E4AA|nr:hypothetical protein [Thermococcus sp. SY098]WRS53594.1 hypothetical protein VFC49_05720 [Thermococcus sp. SY098]